jgi:glucosamine-6-phosphate deaminase
MLNSDESKQKENITTSVYSNSLSASEAVAEKISHLIRKKTAEGKFAVLGLATGSTPTGVYDLLVKKHQAGELSFKNVISFNLDEYYPMSPGSLQSYVKFMNEHLFDHVDILPENIHIPDGELDQKKVTGFCTQYEQKIDELGGIDIQLLGIGRTGHVGFNEPGSGITSRTRLINLDKTTRLDAASDFFGEDNVPRKAITMGVGTIMKAKQVILMAWGEGKASIIQKTVESEVTDLIPASFLQQHPEAEVVLDEPAAAELTRFKAPWLVSNAITWSPDLKKKAVIWLSEKLGKVVLKLTNEDYNEHGMNELLVQQGPAEDINIQIFNELQHTITGWPGGKPNADDSQRPERAEPFPKRIVIFSPHPDDDVISMGGTLLRLVDQGHEVHVAYQTSGNIAVFDDDVLRFVDFAVDFNDQFDSSNENARNIFKKLKKFIVEKQPGQVDLPEIQAIKGMIRRGEAKAACRFCGINSEHIHFLDMPFYETGKVKKKPLSQKDIDIITHLLQSVQPHQIYAAGDLSDPHGTHRVCLDAIFRSVRTLKEQETWLKNTYVWLYRGAWQEWDVAEIEMAVPIGPRELLQKRRAVFKHQSQKDTALFPGSDSREFWERAEDRNRGTARLYDQLGLAEYEAIEAFVRWKF